METETLFALGVLAIIFIVRLVAAIAIYKALRARIVRSPGSPARRVLFTMLFLGIAAAAQASDCTGDIRARDAPIHLVGEFTNMRHTEEHAYGYSVELWRSGKCLFGLFLASEGLAGDTPTGLIENLKFDSRTGAIAFVARLTLGRLTARGLDNVESRDVYRFTGKLNEDSLRGTVRHTNALLPQHPGESAALVLRRSRQHADALRSVATFREWEREVRRMLELRGPKW